VLDLKIEGAQVIDGTGRAGARADVGIKDDRITAIGDLHREPAGSNLHASGKVVAPGFIDMHSHSDWRLWENRRAESKVRQGVTTEVVGNCGFSPAPVSDEFLADLRGFALHVPAGMDFRWRSVGDYLKAFDASGTALNVVQLIGHGTLRVAAMGFARRSPTAAELGRMQTLLADGIEDGAWGLSTGLIYAPGSYATTEEIVALATVAGRHRGFYASHIRGEGATLLDAVQEAIHVGREGDLPVQISHVKAAGRPNWGKVADALALIDAARDEGLDVMADVYPYTASSTMLRALLPDWALEGGIDAMLERLTDPDVRARIRRDVEAPATGQSLLDRIGWENVMVSSCTRRKDAEGKRISEIAASRGMDALDAALELIVAEGGRGSMILFQLDERDLRRALVHDAVMIGSDGSALAPDPAAGKPHPRSYGTFPRVLGEYAREERVLTLPQAIHKMTALPARRLGLKDRGVVAVGARADLVVFDARRVADRATYQEPHQYPSGIEHVLVNGSFVIKDGAHTGSLPGRLLIPA
jgi:N-acyl-D-aspartate/D-glutamate deacylase